MVCRSVIYREVVDFEFDGLGGVCGVEDGILSFGWVRYEKVAVEVLYEVVELCASEWNDDDIKYFNVDISNNQIQRSAHNFRENHQKSLS